MKIKKGSKNIYADLGLVDAGEMLVKARLAARINERLGHRDLTQVEAARLMRISQPKLSGILRGRFRGVSESKLMECLTHLGDDIQIVVKAGRRAQTEGHLSVVFA